MKSKSSAISTVRDLVRLWPSQAAMADDIGVEEYQPRDWARRGRIPAEKIHPVVNAAQKRGFRQVTHELVARIMADSAEAAK